MIPGFQAGVIVGLQTISKSLPFGPDPIRPFYP